MRPKLQLTSSFDPEIYKYRIINNFKTPLCLNERSRVRAQFQRAALLTEINDFFLFESYSSLVAHLSCARERFFFKVALEPHKKPGIISFKPEDYEEIEYPEFIIDFQNKIRGTSLEGRFRISLSADGKHVLVDSVTTFDLVAFASHLIQKQPLPLVELKHRAHLGL